MTVRFLNHALRRGGLFLSLLFLWFPLTTLGQLQSVGDFLDEQGRLAVPDRDVYVGGSFTQTGGALASGVESRGEAAAGTAGVTLTPQSPIALFEELGDEPGSVAFGDVDGDGALDIVTTNQVSRDVSVLLGDGSGGFSAAVGSPFAVGSSPESVALGDVDGDGLLDVVTANRNSDNVSVLLGDGGGGFTAAAGSPFAVGDGPVSVALGDVDGDAALDVVTANRRSDDVSVLLGDGSGGFSAATGSPFAVGSSPESVALGDVDGDGLLDVVTANQNSDDLSVLLGDGGGGFTAATGSPFAVGNGPRSISLGDVDGDGALDGVTANSNSDDVSVLLGDGNGGFTAAAGNPFAVGDFPQSVALGDVDGDDALDVVTANRESNDISVLLGDGGGGFTAAAGSPFAVGDLPLSIALGDIDSDGALDGVTANAFSEDLSVLLGDGSGAFTAASGGPVVFGTDPRAVAVGDLDGDGIADAVVAQESRDAVLALRGLGNGRFTAFGAALPVGDRPFSVALGDVDGDGVLDVVAANRTFGDVSVLLGDGGGGFTAAAGSPFAVGVLPTSVALGDVDGDGALDVVNANGRFDDISVLLGDGGGGFAAAAGSPFAVGDGPTSVALGDVDGDGALDVVTANQFSDDISVLLGDGGGGFTAAAGSPFAVGDSPASVALGDGDGDGALDAITANNNFSGDVSVLLGDGGGGFSAAAGSPFAVGVRPLSVALGDIDGDGAMDAITANNSFSGDVSVLLGDGGGGFSAAAGSPFAVGVGPVSAVLDDVDGDGRPDVIVPSDGSGSGNEFLNVLTSNVLFEDSMQQPSVD